MSRRLRAIHIYVGAVVALALVLLSQTSWQTLGSAEGFRDCFVAFLVLGVLAEASFLKLSIGTATSSVAFVPYLGAILLLGPGWAIAIGGATVLIAETVIRHKPMIKVLHNTAKEVVAVGSAGYIYLFFGGIPSLSEFTLNVPAFAASVTVFFVLNSGATATAIALSSGIPLSESWRKLVGGSLVFDFFSSPLALLLAFLYTRAELVGVIAVILPLFLVRYIYSANLDKERTNRELLELMVKNIEARDPYTSGHSLRVSRLAGALARELSLSGKHVEAVETAALLHDVGKIYGEYAPILSKEGRLTAGEAALMRTHPIRSSELVRTISGFRGEIELSVRHHHENYDGSGYPDGLTGEGIPIGARIIMVADTADAMTTDRPYRAALSYDQVVAELKRCIGRQFDPDVVEAFCRNAVVQRIVIEGQRTPLRLPLDSAIGPKLAIG